MPGMNGMGPMGRGPRTGRGLGPCGTGAAVMGQGVLRGLGRGGLPWGCGRGFGGGRGRGAGLGRGWWTYMSEAAGGGAANAEAQQEGLRAEAAALRERLAEVERRLAELESGDEGEPK